MKNEEIFVTCPDIFLGARQQFFMVSSLASHSVYSIFSWQQSRTRLHKNYFLPSVHAMWAEMNHFLPSVHAIWAEMNCFWSSVHTTCTEMNCFWQYVHAIWAKISLVFPLRIKMRRAVSHFAPKLERKQLR